MATGPWGSESDVDGLSTWDAQGISGVSATLTRQATVAAGANALVWVLYGPNDGTGVAPSIPTWVDEPLTDKWDALGWIATQYIGVVKWNVSGGFDYQ